MRWSLSTLLLTAACAGKTHAPVAQQARLLSERPSGAGLVEQLVDVNGDGKADVFNFYRERAEASRLLVRKEVDLNWDGAIDVRTWFDDEGQIEKEEMDGDFDGRPDWVDNYKGGQRVTSEIDTNYDGRPDLYKIFKKGKLSEKHRDTDYNGRIDFWEVLDEQGNVQRTSKDTDGDGRADIRED